MRYVPTLLVVAAMAWMNSVHGGSIDGRVFKVEMPAEDITLFYVESKSVFTVKLQSRSVSVEGQKMYVGDGKLAIELIAHATDGIFLQGSKYKQGDQFKTGSKIPIRPGYKKATELRAGDIYVTLSGVTFELIEK